jgi:hypothetical protein
LSQQVGVRTAHLVINQVYPDDVPAGGPTERILNALGEARALPPDLAAVAAHADLARKRRRLNERYIERLARDIDAPRTELPLLFAPTLGPSELTELSALLGNGLD